MTSLFMRNGNGGNGLSNKPVVFISSALSPDGHPDPSKVFDFFVIIAARLSIALSHNEFEIILKVPKSQETASSDQRAFIKELAEIKELHKWYSGIIIAPFDTIETEAELSNLIKSNNSAASIPILTIDKFYKADDDGKLLRFKDTVPPAYVVCDSVMGGKLAANCLIKHFYKDTPRIKSRLDILIIKGLEGSDERIDGFITQLNEFANSHKKFLYNLHLSEEWNGNFEREKTREIVDSNLSVLFNKKIDAIFCCNDEMALGTRDAIVDKHDELLSKAITLEKNLDVIDNQLELLCLDENDVTEPECIQLQSVKDRTVIELESINKELTWVSDVKIVGYDGIQEVRYLIINNDQWLLDSVDVQVHEQVAEITKLFEKASSSKSIKIPPKLISKTLKKRKRNHLDHVKS